jgi:hypothetical protein
MPLPRAAARLPLRRPATGVIKRQPHNITIRPAIIILRPLLQTLQAKLTTAAEAAAEAVEIVVAAEVAEVVADHQGEDNQKEDNE